ncbi:MAG: hypothetical protein BGP10_09760 [Rhodanobacter sp. 68-29]|nr:MAG: hypothetical protein ABT17_00020 [Rhodanobacter sp. SCN 69-32]OJY62071.1 MAG: hypothetical protein BGP10_09760 [Rhodanobacter sp. 68-29]
MDRTLRSPQRIYAITTILWAIGLTAHCTWFVWSALTGPPSPDLYANHLSFILIVFLLIRVPFWLVGLMLVLIGEFSVFGRKRDLPSTDSVCN